MDKRIKKSDDPRLHERGAKKILTVFFLSLLIFSLLIALTVWGYEKVYAGKIYLGVKVGSYDAGGQTPTEVNPLVDSLVNQISSEKLNLVTDKNVLTPTLSELGITVNKNKIIKDAYNVGRDKSAIQSIGEKLESLVFSKKVDLVPEINTEKFNDYIKNNTDYNIDAKNATLRVENGQVITVLSEDGSKVDMNDFEHNLVSNFNDLQISRPIILKSVLIKPQINEDQISQIRPTVERMISLPLVLSYNYKNYSADAETIANWIVLKPASKATVNLELSDDKINEFIDSIAKKIYQKPVDKKINASTGDVIEEGKDGLEIDSALVLAKIKESLNSSHPTEENRNIAIDVKEIPKQEKKVQPEATIAEGGTPGLYDGKYVEVNLSTQKLYAYTGNNLEGAYTVSTGKWSTPTPIGTRYIESKSDRAYSAKYDLYMPWWNSIGDGYGIHELPEWASGYKEGQSHLGTPVSHGCIRLGVGPAEFIYNWAPIGTPVYIHK